MLALLLLELGMALGLFSFAENWLKPLASTSR
jgi:hypothetical protein